MEDLKWLLRRCGLPILLLLILVIAGVFCWEKMNAEKQKVAEEVWEPPVEIENSEAETEEVEDAETSTDSAYWFIPQASDDLLSEEEKEQLQSTVLSAAESVREICKDAIIADAPDYNSDLAFRNEIVVRPFEDGTFRYLSNSIEQIELELPPIARKKG